MPVSIIIINLIINLISWYYYFCSAYDCVSRQKFVRRAVMNLKIYMKSSQETLVRRSLTA